MHLNLFKCEILGLQHQRVLIGMSILVSFRARRDYWENLKPASGRPLCPSMSAPDGWGVTKGHTDLMQQKEATSEDQLKQLFDRSKSH